jgi:hypothetical protein
LSVEEIDGGDKGEEAICAGDLVQAIYIGDFVQATYASLAQQLI